MFKKLGICLFFIPLCFTNVIENKLEDLDQDQNVTDPAPNYDYIVKLAYQVEEKKVPQYIIDLIYDQPLDRTIYTEDIISLLGLRTLTIQNTLDVLQVLNTPPDALFSLDGLDHMLKALNIAFKDFYNNLKTVFELGGAPLRNALIALGIDSGTFSDALAYGDPDPFGEFKKGNFSKESLENACSILGLTLDELYAGARTVILEVVQSLPPNQFTTLLSEHGVNRDASRTLWDTLNVTLRDVYNVETFRNLFSEINAKAQAEITLGVINDKSTISIHRKAYNVWKNERQVLSIYGESVEQNIILTVQEILDEEFANIVLLKFVPLPPFGESEITFIPIGYSEKNVFNCQYATIQNDGLVIKDVEKATYHRSNYHFEIRKFDFEQVILGSPLVCESKVFGIARDITEEHILLDSYSGVSIVSSHAITILISTFLSCYAFLS